MISSGCVQSLKFMSVTRKNFFQDAPDMNNKNQPELMIDPPDMQPPPLPTAKSELYSPYVDCYFDSQVKYLNEASTQCQSTIVLDTASLWIKVSRLAGELLFSDGPTAIAWEVGMADGETAVVDILEVARAIGSNRVLEIADKLEIALNEWREK